MKRWDVRLPVVGTLRITVEAETREEAIREALPLRDAALAGELDLETAEVEELDAYVLREYSRFPAAVQAKER